MFTSSFLRAIKSGGKLTVMSTPGTYTRDNWQAITIVFTDRSEDGENVYLVKKREQHIKC